MVFISEPYFKITKYYRCNNRNTRNTIPALELLIIKLFYIVSIHLYRIEKRLKIKIHISRDDLYLLSFFFFFFWK